MRSETPLTDAKKAMLAALNKDSEREKLIETRKAVWLLIQWAEEQEETQAESLPPMKMPLVTTPEEWRKLRQMQEETQASALRATKPSSPDTEVQAAIQRGSVTSFKTWHLVKVDRNGELPITATVTLPASSSIETRGDALNPLLAEGFELKTLTTWESQSQSGQTQSTIPEALAVGPHVGGSAMSPDVSTPSEEELLREANRMLDDFEELLNMEGVYLEYGEGSLANQLVAWREKVAFGSATLSDDTASDEGSTPQRPAP